ncbi:DUF427 domain-containing protein [Aquihabitans sp. G128]|uniref:DUF427 domain-containing protein n=1 Tax=Aquihabitans sp. G128 TaxID=2849779 RepID=UPI001C23BF7F|nr:DUF427 domain-containing protein [Aquihabitans sp. G128]QXC59211.1 DUF427 domain-containing protein [Aquihabitans sp. G128]
MLRPQRIEPGPGQESVWDYPRPPRLEQTSRRIRVAFHGTVVAESTRALRVLETSQPPAYYLPPDDVDLDLLRPTAQHTFCEWKGTASYADVVVGEHVALGATWWYPEPTAPFAPLVGHHAFYAQQLECSVDGEPVEPNDGNFYGGWITSDVVGPFKGAPGTSYW